MNTARVAGAFLRREFLEESSYPLKILVGLAATLVSLGFLVLFTDFVGSALGARAGQLPGGYLAFALIGLSFHTLLDTALRELSARIRQAQVHGTFEALLATRAPLASLMLALPLYPLLRSTLRFGGLLLLGWWLLDVPLRFENGPLVLAVFAASMVVFAALGLTFAGLTVVFKRTEPLIAMFNAGCFFLGGVILPWQELPGALQVVAQALPMTPALAAFRIAAVQGGDWSAVAPELGHLALFAVVLVPTSALVFRWSLRQAMRDGSLGHY